MQVKDFMTKNVVTISPEKKVADAAELMHKHNIGGLPVVEDQTLIGILTESDFIGKMKDVPHSVSIPALLGEWFHNGNIEQIFATSREKTVGEVMISPPVAVTPETSLTEAAKLMLARDISRIPVLQDGLLVGLITKRNILRALV